VRHFTFASDSDIHIEVHAGTQFVEDEELALAEDAREEDALLT
jgi:hypothetical protein